MKPIIPGVARHPSFEAQLGYAVARGTMPLVLADLSVLARYKDLDEAHQRVTEMRRAAAGWRHIRDQLKRRIHELTVANARARLPWNAIMAQAHEVNRSQTLHEGEVTAIVEWAVYETLPDRRRQNGA